MFTWFRNIVLALLLAVLLSAPAWAVGPGVGLFVEELDGDPSGYVYKLLFPNGELSINNSVGTYTGGGAGGAPTNATYITQTSDPILTSEQAISSLSDGILRHVSGVLYQAVAGTHYVAPDTELTALAGVTSAANKLPYFTGSGTADVTDLSVYVRGFLDDADEATLKATLNLEAGTDYNAYDVDLATLATPTTWRLFYSNGTQAIVELALGADGTFLESNGAGAAPAFRLLVNNDLPVNAGDTYSNFGDGADDTVDKLFEAIDTSWPAASISDEAYNATTWDGVTDTGASKNALRDKFESMGGGAPSGATYITQTPDATLSNEQAINSLSDGILKHASGVLAQAVAGTDYVAPDAELTALAGVTSAANKLPYFTGSGTADVTDLSVYARGFLDDADEAALKATLNLEAGVDYNAYSANMDTDGTDDLTTSTSWSGDLSGTGSSPQVDNDSHDHTTSITGKAANVTNADFGDVTVTAGDWAVEDDSHSHVYSDIDGFTEANLYSLLVDVTQFYESGDTIPESDIDSAIARDSELPTVSDVAYDATTWNGNTDAATKNAIRDKIETMDDNPSDDLTTSTSWGGDLSGTGSSPEVDDNSHDHTTTISGKSAGVSDADYGDVNVSGGSWEVEDDSHSHTGMGDITGVLDCASGDCTSLNDAPATFTANDATPDVSDSTGTSYITANTATTTITDLDGTVADGAMRFITIGDNYTTVQFSNANFTGHNELDWDPVAGDAMWCQYKASDTCWRCLVSRPSALAAAKLKTSIVWADPAGPTKTAGWDLSGATTGKKLTLDSNHSDDRTITLPNATTTLMGTDTTDSPTNKTFDSNATGNTLKMYGYLQLANPHMVGSGVQAGLDTTDTNEYYGQVKFADEIDEATNYVEYRCEVPRDIDTSVDLVAWFKFRLGGADTNDHDYVISMQSVADSGDYTGTPANAINLSYTADASGADGDVETAGGDTLTNWKSNVTAGQLWVIRVARDGDDGTNDTSTVDSYSGVLTIRYGISQ